MNFIPEIPFHYVHQDGRPAFISPDNAQAYWLVKRLYLQDCKREMLQAAPWTDEALTKEEIRFIWRQIDLCDERLADARHHANHHHRAQAYEQALQRAESKTEVKDLYIQYDYELQQRISTLIQQQLYARSLFHQTLNRLPA